SRTPSRCARTAECGVVSDEQARGRRALPVSDDDELPTREDAAELFLPVVFGPRVRRRLAQNRPGYLTTPESRCRAKDEFLPRPPMCASSPERMAADAR